MVVGDGAREARAGARARATRVMFRADGGREVGARATDPCVMSGGRGEKPMDPVSSAHEPGTVRLVMFTSGITVVHRVSVAMAAEIGLA
jgi:hypothetical protein